MEDVEMTVREIPLSYQYECDVCGVVHQQLNASGHYTDSRPPGWARLIVRQAAQDYQGQEVADASIDKLLCQECRPGLVRTVNEWAGKVPKRNS
jgi:hypothetical protein